MKSKLQREWGEFESTKFSVVERKIEFAGVTYKPDAAKAFVEVELCHSLPTLNSKGRGWTAATLANSYPSTQLQLVNFDHRLAYYSELTEQDEEDQICGAIAAVDYPDKEEAIALQKAGKPVAVRALLAAYRKAKNIDKMLAEIADGNGKRWRVSVECEYAPKEAKLWDGEKFYDIDDEMAKLILPNGVENFNDKKMGFILGGEDGEVILSGCAFTRWPADKDAKIKTMVASQKLIVNAGWKSPEQWRSAVASMGAVGKEEKSETKNEIASDLIIGYTEPAGSDKHVHPVLRDFRVLPGETGHSHYMQITDFNLDKGLIEGATSGHSCYCEVAGRSMYVEHAHTFKLSATKRSEVAAVNPPVEESPMDIKKHIASLRETAGKLTATNPELAAKLTADAAQLEKEIATEGTEEVIAARIKSGDLVPKAAYESAVAKAAADAKEALEKEAAAKIKAEEERKTTLASRLEKVKAAKIDPAFAIAKDRTVESVIASMPVGEAGDKMFAERLEEWTTLSAKTGQMVASDKAKEKTPVPVGAGSNGGEKKNFRALV